LFLVPMLALAQAGASSGTRQKVFIDTDIGDDVDDAFALALVLSSPELEVVGISGAWGDTELRARMLERFLKETGHSGIPVGAGVKTESQTKFSQREWAEGSTATGPFPDGVTLLQEAIRRYPGQVTLIALGPLTNVGALIDRDPGAIRHLKRVVMMGGSIYKGYETGYEAGYETGYEKGDAGAQSGEPAAEYNIQMDPAAARKLFGAGARVEMMPLDSTLVHMTEARRAELEGQDTPLAKILKELDREWAANSGWTRPTLFDVVPVARLLDAGVCPLAPLRVEVDDKGFTRPVAGKPNVKVCLKLDEARFLTMFYGRLMPKR
jgi:inosine-uridine nucleoside N-ribohydrolase